MMMTVMMMMVFAADHGPLVVMVRTDEGVRYWGSGELVGPAPDLNSTQVDSQNMRISSLSSLSNKNI